jgi:hypothetical protein
MEINGQGLQRGMTQILPDRLQASIEEEYKKNAQ